MLFRRTVDGGKELVQQRAIAGRRAAQEERRMRESKAGRTQTSNSEKDRCDPPAELASGERPLEFVLVPI